MDKPLIRRVPAAQGVANLCEVASHLLKLERNAAVTFALRAVIREAVNKSCEGYRGNDNKKNVRYASEAALAALATGSEKTVADHALPLSLLLNRDLPAVGPADAESIRGLLARYSLMVLITENENHRLSAMGLTKKMPANWDGVDTLARYHAAGIAVRSLTDRSGGAQAPC